MKFNPAVFEKLLFPLHRQAYRQIQEALEKIDEKYPGKLQEILVNFKVSAGTDTQTKTRRKGREEDNVYPSIDISIFYQQSIEIKLSILHKSTDYKIVLDYEEKPPSQYKGSHLTLGFYQEKVLHSFIVPLEYLLGFDEKAVLREGSHQIYSHTILSVENQSILNKQMAANKGKHAKVDTVSFQQFHQSNSLLYIGRTKQSWQHRYRQHTNDKNRGSNLRFHRALRGEFCKIGLLEHIVERAGLTEKQALDIEEKEIEKRSLYLLFPNGLNMIPGGNAGLKYVHNFARRTGYVFEKKITAENVESILVNVQQFSLKKHFKTDVVERINAAISRLWAENVHFRVNAMTHAHNRFSFEQILAARIWHSSGWTNEKILEHLKKMDSKKISMEQLEKLLKGETYSSIPDVLV